LEQASLKIQEKSAEANPKYDQWLKLLLAPGASLGGARLRLKKARAQSIIRDVKASVGNWRSVAAAMSISRTEQDHMANAFRMAGMGA
jgi:hypothetical protein